jgi:AcrR family transcriptional regulator
MARPRAPDGKTSGRSAATSGSAPATRAKPRRMGDASNVTWGRILDVTEQIMLADGYAAVTTSRIAAAARITPAAVIFYFGTMEALFVALVRRRGEQQRERYRRALESGRALRALWEIANDRVGAGLVTELQALSNHRETVRTEFVQWAEEFRQMQIEVLGARPGGWNIGGHELDPAELVSLVAYLSRALVVEEMLGIETGVVETRALIERTIERIEPAQDLGLDRSRHPVFDTGVEPAV